MVEPQHQVTLYRNSVEEWAIGQCLREQHKGTVSKWWSQQCRTQEHNTSTLEMEERGSTTLKRGGQHQEWMETMTVLSRAVQTLLLGLFLPVPVLDSVQVGTAVTLEAQQGPMDDYSTLLSRCSHDNTRFRLRSLTNIPWNTSDHYQAHGTGFQSISLTMGLNSNPEPLACDGDEMITRGVRTRYDLMLWCP